MYFYPHFALVFDSADSHIDTPPLYETFGLFLYMTSVPDSTKVAVGTTGINMYRLLDLQETQLIVLPNKQVWSSIKPPSRDIVQHLQEEVIMVSNKVQSSILCAPKYILPQPQPQLQDDIRLSIINNELSKNSTHLQTYTKL